MDGWQENQLQNMKRFMLGSDAIQSLDLMETSWPHPDPTTQVEPEELTELLCHASNLKYLVLETDVLIRISHMHLATELQERFSALKSLGIIWDNKGSEEKIDIACESFRVLSKVPKMWLRRFEYWDLELDHDLPNYSSMVTAVIGLIEMHQNTLEDLILYCEELWRPDGMAGMMFPSLKTLTAGEFELKQTREGLIQFLENQPFLEGLKLCVDRLPNPDLFKAIQRRSAKLKYFSLNIFTTHIGREHFDWDFLQDLRFLKTVKLSQASDGERLSMCEVISILPTCLESAKIGYTFEGDWREENPHERIIPCFARLHNITKLNFLESSESITDVVLQCIISIYLNQLLELEFENCEEVTDFGITGRRGDEDTGTSLKDLKGEQCEF